MEAHTHTNFIDAVDNSGRLMVQVPAGFASVSQLCDVGIMKRLRHAFLNCANLEKLLNTPDMVVLLKLKSRAVTATAVSGYYLEEVSIS